KVGAAGPPPQDPPPRPPGAEEDGGEEVEVTVDGGRGNGVAIDVASAPAVEAGLYQHGYLSYLPPIPDLSPDVSADLSLGVGVPGGPPGSAPAETGRPDCMRALGLTIRIN